MRPTNLNGKVSRRRLGRLPGLRTVAVIIPAAATASSVDGNSEETATKTHHIAKQNVPALQSIAFDLAPMRDQYKASAEPMRRLSK